MLIKSISRKRNIGQLVRYIFQEEKQKSHTPFVMKFNLSGRDTEQWIKQLEFNASLRKMKRKDQVLIYHEVMSFNAKDTHYINRKVMQDLSKKYIELRGVENMYAICEHRDRQHAHLHIAVSGTRFLTGLSSRMSKASFDKLKKELERYQKEKYPELKHSLVYSKEKARSKDKKYIRQSNKSEITKVLDLVFAQSKTAIEVEKILLDMGHTPYYRNGTLTGVSYRGEMKFRFNRLGYNLQDLGVDRESEKQLKELGSLRNKGDHKDKSTDRIDRNIAELDESEEVEGIDETIDNDDRDR